jgi:hypothetical protein
MSGLIDSYVAAEESIITHFSCNPAAKKIQYTYLRKSRFAVIDVADGADIHVWFGPHEFFGKRSLLYCLMIHSGDGGNDSRPDRRRCP